jgi:hypothetical protein
MRISNEFAAEIVAKMRAAIDSRDELTADEPVDPRDLLLIKLYDDLQTLQGATAFLGGGIRPVQKVEG